MRRHVPALAPLATAIQRAFVTRTRLLTLMATSALVIETAAPLALHSDVSALLFGSAVMGFHIGVGLLQQLDFLSLWAPALLVFIVPLRRSSWASLADGFADAGFYPALGVTAVQICCVIARHDGCLPFSCVPMFKLPRRIDDCLPKSAIITPFPPVVNDAHGARLPKTPEPYYWAPTTEGGMTAADLAKLWRPTLWFGTTANAAQFSSVFWRESLGAEWAGKEHYIVSNFERDARLEAALHAMLAFWKATSGAPPAVDRIRVALALQAECISAFDACIAEAAPSKAPAAKCKSH